jgi:ElaB/YqjD/DUF883 family membrane-anchored ribosome-binding protein
MYRSEMKNRKDNSSKYSNHAFRNGNGKGYATETEGNLLTTVREMSSDATQSMKRRAVELKDSLKDSAADYISKGRKKVRAVRKSAKQKVKQNPKAALCIAAGIGMLAGMCLRRRK